MVWAGRPSKTVLEQCSNPVGRWRRRGLGLHVVRTRSADHGVAEGAHTPRDHGDDAPVSPIKPAPSDEPVEGTYTRVCVQSRL